MNAQDPAFKAFLARQRDDYRSGLPERLAEIDRLWLEATGGSAPQAPLAALERCAHSLAGSGATFGFAGLGQAARELEQILSLLVARPHLTPAVLRDVGQAVAALHRSLPASGARRLSD